MTRSQFFGLLLTPIILRFKKKEGEPVFNVERLQRRIGYLRRYPLTEKEAFKYPFELRDFSPKLLSKYPRKK